MVAKKKTTQNESPTTHIRATKKVAKYLKAQAKKLGLTVPEILDNAFGKTPKV